MENINNAQRAQKIADQLKKEVLKDGKIEDGGITEELLFLFNKDFHVYEYKGMFQELLKILTNPEVSSKLHPMYHGVIGAMLNNLIVSLDAIDNEEFIKYLHYTEVTKYCNSISNEEYAELEVKYNIS